MKKLIAILLSVMMLVCLAACGTTEDPSDAVSDEVATDEVATDEVATDEAATDEVATDEAATDEAATDEAEATDSEAVAALSAVWEDVVADEALIAAFGAASAEEIAGYFSAPAVFDMSDAEAVSATMQISADSLASVEEIAFVMHMMNANNLTAAAYVLADGVDAAAFADEIKADITSAQFICGAPEQLVIAEADGVVIAAFGGADIISTFTNALSANGTVLVEDAIG